MGHFVDGKAAVADKGNPARWQPATQMECAYLGKDKRIALGRYPEVGLAEARQKRDEARQTLEPP